MSRRQGASSDSAPSRENFILLCDEIRLLRQVLDEVRGELSWANNNAQDLAPGEGAMASSARITSELVDPVGRDLHETVVEDTATPSSSQRSLF